MPVSKSIYPVVPQLPYRLFKRSALLLILVVISFQSRAQSYPELNSEQLDWLGKQIYNNECNQQSDCLTTWNTGENFPSLGIGHFIWYQSRQEEIFEESFPLLLIFLESLSIDIPQWIIEEDYNSPWQTREEFIADFNKARQTELRQFLLQHIPQQTQFIVQRFERALNTIIVGSPDSDNVKLEARFLGVANASPPYGLYALIDYLNFKGEGVSELERYNNQGWGLKQVLENMGSDETSFLQQFVYSAKETLETRVNNSPKERREERWLEGWENRLNTYLPP